ncbi:hypothetical protein CRE_16028 [Caenorhabditis remanei]|uniref:F-box associated domain-containing protein n=1 Tax=Caenorhabditis remanei TaxID=31234 RepID=E3MBF2_CAERE|nr:hypothetical protein CRE_16028 [Caenorhabditis remanei]
MPKPLFELMKLPTLALKSVVRFSEPNEVIETSMSSDTFLDELKKFKIPADYLTFIREDSRISLVLGFDDIAINIHCFRFPSETGKLKKLNGEYVFWRKHEGTRRRVTWNFQTADTSIESNFRMIDTVVTYFLTILRIKTFNLSCLMNTPKFSDLSMILNYSKHFGNVGYQRRDIRKTPMSPVELRRLLDGITAETWDLNIRCDGFEYEKPLMKCKRFQSSSIGWVTTDCVLSADIVSVKIDGRPRRFFDFNKIIQYWVDGKIPNLELVQYRQYDTNVDQGQVLRGINTIETIFVEPDFRRRLIDFLDHPVDIKRKTDGRRATALFGPGTIEFCVWKPEYILGLTERSFARYKRSIGEFEY